MVDRRWHSRYPDWVHRTVGLAGLVLAMVYIILMIRALRGVLQVLRQSF
jgi:hypothetical protein